MYTCWRILLTKIVHVFARAAREEAARIRRLRIGLRLSWFMFSPSCLCMTGLIDLVFRKTYGMGV